MVRIKESSILEVNRDKLYASYRDDFDILKKYIQDIENIKTLSIDNRSKNKKITRECKISSIIPPGLSSILPKSVKESIMIYIDNSEWNDELHECYFNIHSKNNSDLYSLVGRNRFVKKGRRTKLISEIDMTINVDNIPLVPLFILNPLIPVIEKFIVEKLKENFKCMTENMSAHLA